MASRLSMVLVLFGVISLALGQVKNDAEKEGSSRLSQIPRADHEMKDTDMLSKQLEQGEVEGVDSQPPLTADELADIVSQIEVPTGRVKRQIGGSSVLNTGPGHDYTNLGSRRDRNGGRHSLLGHYRRQGGSIGAGYQYGTPNGRSAIGAGISNHGYRVGGRHSWTSGRNGRLQHSLSGSYGHNRRTGHSAGLTYRLRFRRGAQQPEEVKDVKPQTPLIEDELADTMSLKEVHTRRFKRQIGGSSVLNTGPGHDYTNLGSLRDRNGGRHSLLGHYQRQGGSIGAGYQYGTPNGRSAIGAGVSNHGYRVGGRHSWTSGRNNRFQHSLSGSYGHNRRTGHSAGLTYRLRFRRGAQQAD